MYGRLALYGCVCVIVCGKCVCVCVCSCGQEGKVSINLASYEEGLCGVVC